MIEHEFNRMQGKFVAGWHVQDSIGQGKSAMVYRAAKDGITRAIKLYDPRMSEGPLRKSQMLRLERQRTIGQHKHPNLVHIYDAGECPVTGLLYVVMELFVGWEELTEPKVPPHRIPAILAQIAGAAQFLEANFQIVHRDIKPANIIIAPDSTRAVLLDLGVVKPVAPNATATSHLLSEVPFVGTFRYSPPEFIAREVSDDDVIGWRAVTFYQIGAVLYELLTSKRFFGEIPDSNWRGLETAKRESVPEFPPALANSPLADLARACLNPDPRKRLLYPDDLSGAGDWARFQLLRLVRRPTVVLLYTGGTFGSEPQDPRPFGGVRERQLRRVTTKNDPYLQLLIERMTSDFKKVYAPIDSMPFDLHWEILPPDKQLLSENATTDTWNNLTSAVDQIVMKYEVLPTQGLAELRAAVADTPHMFEDYVNDASDGSRDADDALVRLHADLGARYLAGVVVFHGTDTMAYSANAIAFGTHNLPCPIVITGANNPPSAERVHERNILSSSSDAWRNATLALHFLACFGHRFTEVFVVFAGTIHHAINLRKVPWTSLISARRGDPASLEEPFVFRNQSVFADYMFKYVDGIYCNNFYPHKGRPYRFMITEEYKDYKHRRWEWYPSGKPIERERFDSGVHFMKIAPLMGGGVVTGEYKLLLIEGYSSGTLPTSADSGFTPVLLAARQMGIPVVLISESGMLPTRERYHEELGEGAIGRIIRLFGIIRESALPLLARSLSAIGGAWNEELPSSASGDADAGGQMQDRRAQLLVDQLRKDFAVKQDILGSVLGKIVDEEDQQENLKEQWQREQKALPASMLVVPRENPLRPALLEQLSRGNRGVVEMRKSDLLRYLIRVQGAFDAPGAGAEASALVSDAGFEWCRQKMRRMLRSVPLTGAMWYVDHSEQERAELLRHVGSCTHALQQVMLRSGLVDLEISKIEEDKRFDIRGREWLTGVRIGFTRIKDQHYGREDERYAMQGWEPAELEWLAALREGVELQEEPNQYEERMERKFARLFDDTWNRRADILDWFVLGLTRGLMVAVVEYLRFDRWVIDCVDQGERGRALLRDSVALAVPTCTSDLLQVTCTYERRFDVDGLPRLWRAEDSPFFLRSDTA